jgi:hypothetical protein
MNQLIQHKHEKLLSSELLQNSSNNNSSNNSNNNELNIIQQNEFNEKCFLTIQKLQEEIKSNLRVIERIEEVRMEMKQIRKTKKEDLQQLQLQTVVEEKLSEIKGLNQLEDLLLKDENILLIIKDDPSLMKKLQSILLLTQSQSSQSVSAVVKRIYKNLLESPLPIEFKKKEVYRIAESKSVDLLLSSLSSSSLTTTTETEDYEEDGIILFIKKNPNQMITLLEQLILLPTKRDSSSRFKRVVEFCVFMLQKSLQEGILKFKSGGITITVTSSYPPSIRMHFIRLILKKELKFSLYYFYLYDLLSSSSSSSSSGGGRGSSKSCLSSLESLCLQYQMELRDFPFIIEEYNKLLKDSSSVSSSLLFRVFKLFVGLNCFPHLVLKMELKDYCLLVENELRRMQSQTISSSLMLKNVKGVLGLDECLKFHVKSVEADKSGGSNNNREYSKEYLEIKRILG